MLASEKAASRDLLEVNMLLQMVIRAMKVSKDFDKEVITRLNQIVDDIDNIRDDMR